MLMLQRQWQRFMNKRNVIEHVLDFFIEKVHGTERSSPSRTFLQSLIDLTVGVVHPSHHISLSKAARADMQAGSLFLSQFNGKLLFSDQHWLPAYQLGLHMAVSDQGFVIVLGRDWCHHRWSDYQQYTTCTART